MKATKTKRGYRTTGNTKGLPRHPMQVRYAIWRSKQADTYVNGGVTPPREAPEWVLDFAMWSSFPFPFYEVKK